MSEQKPAKTLFLCLSDPKGLRQVASIASTIGQDDRFELFQVSTVADAAQKLQTAERAILFFEANTKQRIVDIVTLIAAGARLQQKGLLRTIGFLTIPVPNPTPIENVLKQKGVNEILSDRLAAKGIQYKLNRLNDVLVSTWNKANGRSGQESGAYVDWIDSLNTQSDFWILQKLGDVKLRRGMWMIHMIGPPPICGKWEVDRSLKWMNQDAWVFKFSSNESAFVKDPGKWIFWGNRPTFSAQTCLWLFVAKKPKFAFIPQKGGEINRIKQEKSGILFAKNSPNAEAITDEIRRILISEHRFTAKKDSGQELSLEMQGKEGSFDPSFMISTDTLAGAPLGKVEISEDADELELGTSEENTIALSKSKRSQSVGSEAEDESFGDDGSGSLHYGGKKKRGAGGEISYEDDESAGGESGNYRSLVDPSGDSQGMAGSEPQGRDSKELEIAKDGDSGAELAGTSESKSRSATDTESDTGAESDAPSKPRSSQLQSEELKLEDKKELYDELFNELGFSLTVTPFHVQGVSEIRPTTVKLLDLFEDQLSIEVPKLQLRKSQKVMVRFQVTGKAVPLDYSVSGSVNEIESVEDGFAVVGLTLANPDQKKLKEFLDIFESRQEQVSDFIASAKGR